MTYDNRIKRLAVDIYDHSYSVEKWKSYSAQIVRIYRKRDITFKWIVGVAACGPFIEKMQSETEMFTSWFLALVPLIAFLLPLLNYSKIVEHAANQNQQYSDFTPTLQKLRRQVQVCWESGNVEDIERLEKELEDLELSLATARKHRTELPNIHRIAQNAEARATKFKLPLWAQEDTPTYEHNLDNIAI